VLDRTTPHEDPTAWRQALLILAAAALLRLALAAVVPLFPDEAYYWEWSRRLAGGYFDHPPVIAWLVRAAPRCSVRHRSRSAWRRSSSRARAASRSPSPRARSPGTARRATPRLIFSVMPLAAAGLVIATPDAPLLAALAWTLYAVVRALGAAPRQHRRDALVARRRARDRVRHVVQVHRRLRAHRAAHRIRGGAVVARALPRAGPLARGARSPPR
jgi:hypothetical protein